MSDPIKFGLGDIVRIRYGQNVNPEIMGYEGKVVRNDNAPPLTHTIVIGRDQNKRYWYVDPRYLEPHQKSSCSFSAVFDGVVPDIIPHWVVDDLGITTGDTISITVRKVDA